MAYHSVQAPRLGIPQMIHSRAQFAMFEAVQITVVVMCVGSFISSTLLAERRRRSSPTSPRTGGPRSARRSPC
jgi:purine-cytosine permease-like protein